MPSPCRVTLIANQENLAVLVEDAGDPHILLRGLEGGPREIGPLVNRAWRDTIRTREVSDIDLHLGSKLPIQQRNEILKWQCWLTRRILGLPLRCIQRIQRKPPASEPVLAQPILPFTSYIDPATFGHKGPAKLVRDVLQLREIMAGRR